MLDVKHPPQTHPSLLPLRMALTVAESGVPPCPVRQLTADEQRALDLIEKMKTEHNKPLSFTNFVHRSPKSLRSTPMGLILDAKSRDFAPRINFKEVIKANA